MKKIVLRGWKSLPLGGIIPEGGNSHDYATGSWRSFRPVLDADKCIHCLICWIMCPDSSVVVREGKVLGFDLAHCKGCGICDEVCPDKVKCIAMVDEGEAKEAYGDKDMDDQVLPWEPGTY